MDNENACLTSYFPSQFIFHHFQTRSTNLSQWKYFTWKQLKEIYFCSSVAFFLFLSSFVMIIRQFLGLSESDKGAWGTAFWRRRNCIFGVKSAVGGHQTSWKLVGWKNGLWLFRVKRVISGGRPSLNVFQPWIIFICEKKTVQLLTYRAAWREGLLVEWTRGHQQRAAWGCPAVFFCLFCTRAALQNSRRGPARGADAARTQETHAAPEPREPHSRVTGGAPYSSRFAFCTQHFSFHLIDKNQRRTYTTVIGMLTLAWAFNLAREIWD